VTERRRPIAPVVLATAGLVVALGLRPATVRVIVAAYVLALAAIALLSLTRLARTEEEWERTGSELDRALAPRKAVRTRPADLIRTERDLTLASVSAGELHVRLLPQLREIAAARLAAAGRGDLAHARALIGDDDAWELLRPDRTAPPDRSAPGLPLRRIASLLDTIERL